ncbi:fibrinogen-like protein 1 [Drosophila bipectinata]|uniref:fibrinogen-like protein 1 n=1 Tax=Drosophila bipectinata TaxID=42026 RepID=UPI001C8AE3D1|nr:fibrinogen-like protein 1 [Drosophila bipectinata]
MQLPGSDPLKVVCLSDSELGSGWLMIYRKHYNSPKLNRTYEDFDSGFGDLGTDSIPYYFIGLNRLHILTSGMAHEVILTTFPLGRRRCEHFVIGDRREGFKVKSIANCTGDDIWLSPKQGSKFSTFDQDEDGVPGRNLVKEEGFGWWFDPDMSRISHESDHIGVFIRRTG